MSETTTLPDLTGSPKQIAWATSLRDQLTDGIRQMADRYRDQRDAADAILRPAILTAATSLTDATWWIERRPESGQNAARCVARSTFNTLPLARRQEITAQLQALTA